MSRIFITTQQKPNSFPQFRACEVGWHRKTVFPLKYFTLDAAVIQLRNGAGCCGVLVAKGPRINGFLLGMCKLSDKANESCLSSLPVKT
jgi:hypothetical protein